MNPGLEHALNHAAVLAAHWHHTGGLDAAIYTAWAALAATLAVITAESVTGTEPTDGTGTAALQRRQIELRTLRSPTPTQPKAHMKWQNDWTDIRPPAGQPREGHLLR